MRELRIDDAGSTNNAKQILIAGSFIQLLTATKISKPMMV